MYIYRCAQNMRFPSGNTGIRHSNIKYNFLLVGSRDKKTTTCGWKRNTKKIIPPLFIVLLLTHYLCINSHNYWKVDKGHLHWPMIGGKILILKALLQQSVSLRGSSSLEIKPSNHPHWKQAEGLQNLRGCGGGWGVGVGIMWSQTGSECYSWLCLAIRIHYGMVSASTSQQFYKVLQTDHTKRCACQK